MRRQGRRTTAAAGQVTSEYALVLGAIAVGCIIAILALGNLINGLFTDPAPFPAQPQQPFAPPAARSAALPNSITDCIDGRWRNYVGFTNQADCEAYVLGNAP